MCLSVRQPWAWLIVNGYKDIENRTWPTRFRGPCLIHTGKTMTREDYLACEIFVAGIDYLLPKGFIIPEFEELERGGIVGKVDIVGCVTKSASPWFCGDYGFVMSNPQVLPFEPMNGQRGFFKKA